MTRLWSFRTAAVAAIPSLAAILLVAQTGDPMAVLQQKVTSQFKLTRTTADRTDIVTAGDIIQIHKDGLLMYTVESPMPSSNSYSYKNGKIGQGWGGFGKDLAITMAAPEGTTANDYQRRPLVAEEKCWVTGIHMDKDGVVFQLYSDPYNDVRYYANLKIPFANKKEVPSADAFLAAIHEVLTVVPQDGQGNDQQAGNQQNNDQQGGNQQDPGTSTDQGGQQSATAQSNPVSVLQPSTFTGDYVVQSARAHMIFFPDGSFKAVTADGKLFQLGQFRVIGSTLMIDSWSPAASVTMQIQGNSLFAGRSTVWTRAGEAPAPSIAPGQVFQGTTDAQRAAFAGEYLRQADGQRTTVFPDGTFKATLASGRVIPGQYSVDGNALIITAPSAVAGQRDTLAGDKLVSESTSSFSVRVGDAPASMAAAGSPASLQAIPPPPPPADTPPPTVSVKMGESKDKITTDFGQPTKTVKLGVKEIYYYKDMKVTFMNGKVSNIE